VTYGRFSLPTKKYLGGFDANLARQDRRLARNGTFGIVKTCGWAIEYMLNDWNLS